MSKNLADVKRRKLDELLSGLLAAEPSASKMAAERLVLEARDTGLSMQNFLRLAALPTVSDEKDVAKYKGLDGFEASLAYLNLPFREDLDKGVLLQAAGDTFVKYPGTRAMFPEVIDTMLRWKNRQNQIETVESLVSQTRTLNGTEVISTVIEDTEADRGSFSIAEGGRIPIRTLKTSQKTIGIFKHGSGIKTTYEFERRAGLDIMTPFAARVARELELSKVRAATAILVGGDGVNGAAPVTNFTSLGGVAVGTTPLRQQYGALMTWIVNRAANGVPIDTIVGNLAMYLELMLMFTPTVNGTSLAQAMGEVGGPVINVRMPVFGGAVNFALSSSMPNNKLLGYSKADTMEELIENGSTISENEKSIQNQTITYVRTENTGYRLVFEDTRSVLDLTA